MIHGDLLNAVNGAEATEFVVKGGDKEAGAGGMVRSVVGDKTDVTLALDGEMFRRWAAHLTRATRPPASYPKRNWLLATNGTVEEKLATMERARESAMRHVLQWYRGDSDEDHAAAVYFNINVHETVKASIK